MQTVNFRCGHCDKVMAVTQDCLGQQVRCPHCQQVVLAPAAPGAAAPSTPGRVPPPGPTQVSDPATAAPSGNGPAAGPLVPPMPDLTLPGRDEHESIFAPEPEPDDLFSAEPTPRVELPGGVPNWLPDLAPVTPAPGPAAAVASATAPLPAAPPGAFWEQPLPSPAPEAAAPPPSVQPSLPFEKSLAETEAHAEEEPLLPTGPSAAAQAAARSSRGGWFTALVVVPLISYSLLATIAIILLLTRPAPPHPLEALPDLEGDGKGATKLKNGSLRYRVPPPDTTPLPAHLKTSLGQPVAVGDVEVTPLRVERRRIAYRTEGRDRVEPSREESLVLWLQLRNRSRDVLFKPMDRFFTRRWKPLKAGAELMPFTMLVMGERTFYGGPTAWQPPARSDRFRDPVELIEGQNYDTELRPGEETTTFVCTDPDDHAAAALDKYDGQLLWRVQVRRGLLRWTTPRGVEREDPTTAVIGVQFGAREVVRASS